MVLAAGERATVQVLVTEADTAIAVGSGDVPVLATPRLLALAEAACVAAIAPHLPDGMTSVGTAVSLEHRRACPVGAEVTVEAELTELDGRRLVCSFIARQTGQPPGAGRPATGGGRPATGGGGPAPAGTGDGGEELVIGAGTVERVVVDRAKFLARVAWAG